MRLHRAVERRALGAVPAVDAGAGRGLDCHFSARERV
jgi:hypothetical protein